MNTKPSDEETETVTRAPREFGRFGRKTVPGVMAGKKLPMAGKKLPEEHQS